MKDENDPSSQISPPMGESSPHIPGPSKYQVRFPQAFEQVLEPLDDAVVRVVQKRTQGLIHLMVMSFTFFTSIEVSLAAPATLYALGYDSAAGLTGSVLLVLGIVSQIPKKFIFRPRPWMVNRAIVVRRDKTSSFPSRAVVCAVVFSWLIAWSLAYEGVVAMPMPRLKLWLAIIFVSLVTAFARINVGAHYASDTIFGFLLGVGVVVLGSRLETFWRSCGCQIPSAYARHPAQIITDIGALKHLSWAVLLASIFIAYAMTLVSIQGFWVKCSYVYGLLFSAATFRAVFLCSGGSATFKSGIAQILDRGTAQTHVRAVLVFSAFLIFGMITRGKKGPFRIITFTIIYFGSLICMLVWRLRQDGIERIEL